MASSGLGRRLVRFTMTVPARALPFFARARGMRTAWQDY
jgi:hypothetical protein